MQREDEREWSERRTDDNFINLIIFYAKLTGNSLNLIN